jgi:hypothetical protein
MISRIQNIYDQAISVAQVNGYLSSPIPIKSSIRHGCPLSMILYAIIINPLLNALQATLPGIQIGRRQPTTSVTAYADDITIILTSPDNIPKLQQVLNTCAQASGANINIKKSQALALGTWDKNIQILDIPYKDQITVLGLKLKQKVDSSREESWKLTTANISNGVIRPHAHF